MGGVSLGDSLRDGGVAAGDGTAGKTGQQQAQSGRAQCGHGCLLVVDAAGARTLRVAVRAR